MVAGEGAKPPVFMRGNFTEHPHSRLLLYTNIRCDSAGANLVSILDNQAIARTWRRILPLPVCMTAIPTVPSARYRNAVFANDSRLRLPTRSNTHPLLSQQPPCSRTRVT